MRGSGFKKGRSNREQKAAIILPFPPFDWQLLLVVDGSCEIFTHLISQINVYI